MAAQIKALGLVFNVVSEGSISQTGGPLSVVAGLTVWISCETLAPDAIMPPQLAGLVASIAGMLLGSLVPRDQLKAV